MLKPPILCKKKQDKCERSPLIMMESSQPVGEDKYAFVHRLKEFLYSFFHALPINSIHKPLISIKIEFSSKVLILSLFIVEIFDF